MSRWLGWGVTALACTALAEDAGRPVSFNFEVRPLLSDRCFGCHGPDARSRKAHLRLDTREGAFAVLDPDTDLRVVAPGDLDQSELYRRITTDDLDDRMPPAKSNLRLTDAEQDLLKRWIEQGAEYQSHWAFIPVPDQVPAPKVQASERVRNPIDAFVLGRLKDEGLSLAPEASRETLIRRVSLDLTGLPPAIEEMDAFLADPSPEAYEKLVDRLLASPAYGERRATEWLDLARYADTYGFQNDVDRDMSPWRDWVIRAFNDNLPYDQFILWQVAGDLLPDAKRDQVLATAFNRLHRMTNEGGSVEEEFRAAYAADRVDTASTAFLGLTMGCARCHDHKFDPITQKDYYRMFAFFNNIDESGLYSHFTRATPTPTLLLYPEGVEAKHRELKRQIAEREARLDQLAAEARPAFTQWMNPQAAAVEPPEPQAVFHFDLVEKNKSPNSVNTNQPASLVDGPKQVAGRFGQALQFSGDNSAVCKGVGAFNRTTPFSISLWLRPATNHQRAVVLHRSRAWTDSGSRGYELLIEEGRPSFALIHFYPGNAVHVRAKQALPIQAWSQLTVTYDGSSRARGVRLYLNGQPLPVEVVRDHLYKDILHRKAWGDAEVGKIELTLAGRFRDSGFKDGAIDELQVFDQCLTPVEVEKLAGPAPGRPDRESLFAYYLHRVHAPYRSALAELRKLREAENDLVNDVPEIMVMHEMTPRRPTFVLKRGAYDAPGEPVEPGTPESILPFPDELPRNRLGLARWMIDRRNPLTARVAVNRAWQVHFGRGLVATPEDFGSQGKLPTHPELLDWLAAWFMDHGWNLKALHKLIVTSATYRQSSQAPPELVARDPENRLLARGPKHRLAAEQIRDSALAISGLLSRRLGGPSVKPYQPKGLWRESGTGKTYVQDHGEKLYRRSLYTFWRRTAPPPNMLTFDAVSREVCTARREITTTPLQALVLLNDVQFVEAARVLAERLLHAPGDNLDERITRAFRLATGRRPAAREREILHRLYSEQCEYFEQHPEAAAQYLRTGERPVDKALPPTDLAATTVLAGAVMNLDEFVTKR